MPTFLLNFTYRFNARTHLLFALAAGLFFRLLSTFLVYGPQALDDYKHGMIPAFQYLHHLPMDLPGYRNPILHEMFAFFMKIGNALGGHSALAEVWSVSLGLTLIAMLGIYGIYRLAYPHQHHESTVIAVYLMSLQGIMPFVSTRAFGEVVAMNLVIFGLGLIESERYKKRPHSIAYVWAWLFVGLAVLFRFQVGILYIPLVIMFFLKREKKVAVSGLVAGVMILALQIWIDFSHGKGFLGTLFTYLKENQGGAANYGSSPWYNTWALILGLTLFPFSLVFVPKLRDLWDEYSHLIVPFLIFVGVHSLVPHKEERFMYPVFGFIWLFLGYVWGHQTKGTWTKRIYFPVFIVLNTILLLALSTNNSQGGEVEPMANAQKQYSDVLYVDLNSLIGPSRIKEYFIRPGSDLIVLDAPEAVTAEALSTILKENSKVHRGLVLATSETELLAKLNELRESVRLEYSNCSEIKTAGSFVDNTVFRMNPNKNRRRRPTWYFSCDLHT